MVNLIGSASQSPPERETPRIWAVSGRGDQNGTAVEHDGGIPRESSDASMLRWTFPILTASGPTSNAYIRPAAPNESKPSDFRVPLPTEGLEPPSMTA